MNEKELNDKLTLIATRANEQKRGILIEYATSNNPYKIGDIIEDQVGKMRIEKWRISIGNDISYCVYYGIELKSNGTPRKKQEGRGVYQHNIKAVK